mgnify:CR=1 FL=1
MNTKQKKAVSDIIFNHLLGHDIFDDAFKLKQEFDSLSHEYELLNDIVEMNIKIHALNNNLTATLRQIQKTF